MILVVIALLLVSELIGSFGQFCYKHALNRIGSSSYSQFLRTSLSTPMIWYGFGLLTISIIIWMAALSFTDLNIISSLDSMDYLMILFGARLFLGEKLGKEKILGTLLVVAGIIVVAMS